MKHRKNISISPNLVAEERYQLVLALYLIRKQSRGKMGLFQPDFIWKIFSPYLRNPKLWRTDADIKEAVSEWCDDSVAAEAKFGNICDWETSTITDMSDMLGNSDNASAFNADISRWDTSKVTDMGCMFNNASAFNADISRWDTSKVINMIGAGFVNKHSVD